MLEDLVNEEIRNSLEKRKKFKVKSVKYTKNSLVTSFAYFLEGFCLTI